MGEPLNETGLDGHGLIVRGLHRLSVDAARPAAARWQRAAQADSMLHPLLFFAPLPPGTSPAQYASQYTTRRPGLSDALPPNVAVVTWQALNASTALLRLAHM